jgi:xylono-1,5-lactonase
MRAGASAMMKAECVCEIGAQLGEGPLWSAAELAVWFVDIKGHRIHRFEPETHKLRSWNTPEDVGFIARVTGGRFLCGLKSGLYSFEPATGALSLVTLVDSDRPRNRLNDGFVDASGRLWFGTMDDEEVEPTGVLYRFDAQGLKRCAADYVITNGQATSPDGRTLYHVDTLQKVIYAFDLAADGGVANGRIFARIEHEGGYPDGTAVDSAGCIWVGLFGGWGVQRFSPEGDLIETLPLPVANCTKPAFGGDDLRTLYITTAWKGLSPAQRAEQPLAGGLFAVRVPTAGLPSNELRL